MIILSNEIANEGMGKISAQPHTILYYFCDVFYFSSDQERICQRKICWTQVTVFLPNKWLESCWNDYKKVSLSVLIFVLSFTWVFHNNLIGGAKDTEPCFASLRN